jgi:hypothetical protein
MTNWHLNGKPMSETRRAAVLADIDHRIAERLTFEPGERLYWYRSHRNTPSWYQQVLFVRYAGKTRALITDTGGTERRVPVDALNRERG